jgi:hypothetical protein
VTKEEGATVRAIAPDLRTAWLVALRAVLRRAFRSILCVGCGCGEWLLWERKMVKVKAGLRGMNHFWLIT